jgi:3-oxoadipate enol-lactonase
MPFANLTSHNIHYQITGDEAAPVLIFSNSLGTNLHLWDHQISWLSRHFRCIAYDKRGHGQSTTPTGDYSMADLGQDVINLMDHLDIETANWIGLSIGGMTGQWLAANHPLRFEKMVFANTSSFAGGTRQVWVDRIKLVMEEGMDIIASSTTDRWFTKAFQTADPAAVEKMMSMVRQADRQGYASCCAAIRDMDQRESNLSVNLPIMVINGTVDVATPPDMGRLIAETVPNARLEEFEAPHISNVEQQSRFDDAVRIFFEL